MTIYQVKGDWGMAETDSSLSPALATIYGYTPFFILAWKQANPSKQIMVSTSSDGISWSAPNPIPQAETNLSPSLTMGIPPEVGPTDPLLYAAWTGKNASEGFPDNIYYSTWYNPQSTTPDWQPQLTVPLGVTTDCAPALTTNNGVDIVVAWRNPDDTISYTSIPKGAIGQLTPTNIDEQTPYPLSPTVASVSIEAEDYLLFAWTGLSSHLWYKQLAIGASGGTHHQVISSGSIQTSKFAPALPSSLQIALPISGTSVGLAWVNNTGIISASNDFPGSVPITEVPDTATTASPAYGGPGGLLAFAKADGNIYTCMAPG